MFRARNICPGGVRPGGAARIPRKGAGPARRLCPPAIQVPTEQPPPPGPPAGPVAAEWPPPGRSMGTVRIWSPAAPRQPVEIQGAWPCCPLRQHTPPSVRQVSSNLCGSVLGLDPDVACTRTDTAMTSCQRPHDGIRASTPTLPDPSTAPAGPTLHINPDLRERPHPAAMVCGRRTGSPAALFPVDPGLGRCSAPRRFDDVDVNFSNRFGYYVIPWHGSR